MTDHTVKVSIDDDIASIILDRAEVRNALNRDTMVQLRDAALAVSDKDQVRAVIIRAEGTDFSVGADLKEVSVMEPGGSLLRARRDAELGQKLLRLFVRFTSRRFALCKALPRAAAPVLRLPAISGLRQRMRVWAWARSRWA